MMLPSKVSLPHRVGRELGEACRKRRPNEACGVLFGRAAGFAVRIDGFALVRNAASEAGRAFSFEPSDWIRTYYEAQKNQREIVGFFHSHPEGPPLPSPEDAEGWLPWGTYGIVAFPENAVRIAFYRRGEGSRWLAAELEGQSDDRSGGQNFSACSNTRTNRRGWPPGGNGSF